MQKPELENNNLITAKKATAMRKRQDAPNKELKHIEDALRVLQSNIAAFAASLLLSMVLAGRRLLAAKALLPHGEYTPWIEKNFSGSISVRTAQRYTTIAAFVENNMHRLRAELGETIEPGEGAGLTDDEILLRLPASKVNELIAYDKKDSAQKAKPPVATRILTDRFASAITDFLGGLLEIRY